MGTVTVFGRNGKTTATCSPVKKKLKGGENAPYSTMKKTQRPLPSDWICGEVIITSLYINYFTGLHRLKRKRAGYSLG